MSLRRFLSLTLTTLLIAGCSSKPAPVESARGPANTEPGPMCDNFAVPKVAHSMIRNMCTLDYIWSLTSPEGASTNLKTCAASYALTGAVVASSAALGARRLLNGDGSFQRVLRGEFNALFQQAPETFAWLEDLDKHSYVYKQGEPRSVIRQQAGARLFEDYNTKYSKRILGEYRSSTLNAIKLQPKRLVRIHFAVPGNDAFYLGVTPGPTEAQFKIGRSLTKLAYLGAATMATGGILFVVDQIAGATPTACSQISEKYYSADPNNYCKPRMAISPEVIEFLNLDTEAQRQMLTTFPELCGVYDSIAGSVDADMAKQFDAKSITQRCERDYLAVDLEMANTTKAEIQIDSKEIRVLSSADKIVAQYERSPTGMKLTSIRWAPFIGGVKARTFKMPVDTETFNTPLFQRVQSRLGTYILHLENKGLFDDTCLTAR